VIRDGVSREPSTGKDRNILCVGRDRELLSLRAMVLRGAGFRVIEESDATRAVQLALGNSIDLLLLCHTLNSIEHTRIIHSLRAARQHMLIACVTTLEHQGAPAGAVAVPSDAPRLIEALEKIFQAAQV
jgi:CheY-like chemotaxis protein